MKKGFERHQGLLGVLVVVVTEGEDSSVVESMLGFANEPRLMRRALLIEC